LLSISPTTVTFIIGSLLTIDSLHNAWWYSGSLFGTEQTWKCREEEFNGKVI
jgi:hypothetical protein